MKMENSEVLRIGSLLWHGTYEITHLHHVGETFITYLADDLNLRQRVLIREFYPVHYCSRRPDGRVYVSAPNAESIFNNMKEKFVKEAKLMVQGLSPSVDKVHTAFEDNGTAYYVTDYDGPDPDATVIPVAQGPASSEAVAGAAEKGAANTTDDTLYEIPESIDEKPERKRGKGLLYGIGIAAIVIGLVVIGAVFLPFGEEQPGDAPTKIETIDINMVTDMAWDSPLGLGKYSGPVNDRRRPDGEGVLKVAAGRFTGSTYEGAFVDGTLQGKAKYTMANGDTFVGTFVDNVPGEGKWYNRDGYEM